MLSLTDISARIAGRLLIDRASLFLPEGTKAGFVGRNGAGKSTLFRVLSGDLAPETGTVSLPRHCRIGQVAQEAPGTGEPLIDIVLRADAERLALLAEAETATDPHRIAEIQTRLVDIDAHSATARRQHPRRAWLRRDRAAAPGGEFLRRLAHAGRPCRSAVCQARPAAA